MIAHIIYVTALWKLIVTFWTLPCQMVHFVVTYSVSLELVEVPLVPLSLELGLESAHVALNLVPGHLTGRHAIYDHRALRQRYGG